MMKANSTNIDMVKNDTENQKLFPGKRMQTHKPPVVRSCRICLGEENEPENELINPCKCAGTMKYIHI